MEVVWGIVALKNAAEKGALLLFELLHPLVDELLLSVKLLLLLVVGHFF